MKKIIQRTQHFADTIDSMYSPKVIFITGCSSGIGFETALKFAREGEAVFAGVRNLKADGARILVEIASQEHLNLQLVHVDVTKDQQVKSAINEVISKAKHIDVLVNNAGFGFTGAVEDFSIEELQEQYNTNIFGVVRMIKAVAPYMRQQKSGVIINLSSINGLISFPLYSIYSSSKFALETLSEGMRFEMRPFGIKVILIEPGVFKTGFTSNRKFPQQQLNPASPYFDLNKRFFGKLDQLDQAKSEGFWTPLLHPKRVANKIYRISRLKHPHTRYLVGVDAHILFWLKRLLPEWIRFRLLQRVYHWK
jgi:short-subunit dehydrogenase